MRQGEDHQRTIHPEEIVGIQPVQEQRNRRHHQRDARADYARAFFLVNVRVFKVRRDDGIAMKLFHASYAYFS